MFAAKYESEQEGNIEFFCRQEISVAETLVSLTAVYEYEAPNNPLYTHLQTTKSYILAYDKRRRGPTTSKNDENVTEVRTTLTPDRRVTTEQIANETAISSRWILSILKDVTAASV